MTIHSFFEKKDLIILHIAEFITQSTVDSYTLNTLSKKTQIDRRSLVSAIDDYNLLNLAHSGLSLYISQEQVSATIAPSFTLKRLRQLLFRETLIFRLCDSLFNRQFVTLVEFANNHFISLSSMYRRLNKLKLLLTDYHLSLDFTHTNYFIGDEKLIRHFFFTLYNYTYSPAEEPILTSLTKQIEIDSFLSPLSYLPWPTQKKIQLFSYISAIRLQQGYLLVEDNFPYSAYDLLLPSHRLKKVMSQLTHLFPKKSLDSHTEADFFAFYIQTFDIISLEQFAYIDFIYPESNPHMTLAQSWIKELILFLNLRLTPIEYVYLLTNLYHHYIRLDRLEQATLQNYHVTFEDDFKKTEPYSYKKSALFIQHLQTISDFSHVESLTYLYHLLIRDILLHAESPISLCILSSLFDAQQLNIEKKIQQLSPIDIEYQRKVQPGLDLVIADFTQPEQMRLSKHTQWLTISSFPTAKEYAAIKDLIFNIYDDKLLTKKPPPSI